MKKRYAIRLANPEKTLVEEIRAVCTQNGVFLNMEGDLLWISVDTEWRDKIQPKNPRNAGRKKKFIQTGEKKQITFNDGESYEVDAHYKYSDIVWMNQKMTDEDLRKKLVTKTYNVNTGGYDEKPISQATYYRRKKKMKSSVYYERLDKNRLNDLEYLRSIPGDIAF